MRFLSKKNKLLIVVFIILILAILSLFQNNVKEFVYTISQPIQENFWKAGGKFSNFFRTFSETNWLKKEVEALKIQNQQLLSEIAFLKELEKENESLRAALEIEPKKEFKLALAEVTAKDFEEDFILINRGASSGLFEGLPVINQSKVLIGKISQVHKNFSKIMLISNKKSSLDVKVQDKEIQGVLEGRGNLSLFLCLIPKDKEIEKENIIITTSLGGFPKGLLVGKIKEVKKSDVSPLQEAEVSPFFDFAQLETVFVILNF